MRFFEASISGSVITFGVLVMSGKFIYKVVLEKELRGWKSSAQVVLRQLVTSETNKSN